MYGLILCAGKGSRMQPLSDLLPKPLLPIDDKPVIYHTMMSLLELDLDGIGLVIHPRDNQVFTKFLSHYFDKVNSDRIDIFHQQELNGIIPAIQTADTYRDHDILVCAGDTKFEADHISKFVEIDKTGTDIIIGVRQRNKEELLQRSVIVLDDEFVVKNTVEKPTEEELNRLGSTWSGVPIWYFAGNCWSLFSSAKPSNHGEIVVEGVINEVKQRHGVVKAIEIPSSRDITSPEDVMLENFPYISRLLNDPKHCRFG